jgi:ADP-ribose pyrophosphatase
MALQRRPVLKIGVVDVGVEKAVLPNGLEIELAIVRHPGASAVVALDEHGFVVMLSQYRYAVNGWLREVPAGCRRKDESPRQCAERELREEAGICAARWDHLGSIVTIPSFCDERIELFLARQLSTTLTDRDRDEVIKVDRLSLADALALIRSGQIIDAKTIAALHHAHAFLEKERAGNRAPSTDS